MRNRSIWIWFVYWLSFFFRLWGSLIRNISMCTDRMNRNFNFLCDVLFVPHWTFSESLKFLLWCNLVFRPGHLSKRRKSVLILNIFTHCSIHHFWPKMSPSASPPFTNSAISLDRMTSQQEVKLGVEGRLLLIVGGGNSIYGHISWPWWISVVIEMRITCGRRD